MAFRNALCAFSIARRSGLQRAESVVSWFLLARSCLQLNVDEVDDRLYCRISAGLWSAERGPGEYDWLSVSKSRTWILGGMSLCRGDA